MKSTKLYKEIVGLVIQIDSSRKSVNRFWIEKSAKQLKDIVKNYMPSGSGFDCGTKIDLGLSNRSMLVFHTEFHHMNEVGMYDGWTEHTIRVRADLLSDFTMTISGKNRNDIKDYIYEMFDCALREEIGLSEKA